MRYAQRIELRFELLKAFMVDPDMHDVTVEAKYVENFGFASRQFCDSYMGLLRGSVWWSLPFAVLGLLPTVHLRMSQKIDDDVYESVLH